jgi:hypothetical protein
MKHFNSQYPTGKRWGTGRSLTPKVAVLAAATPSLHALDLAKLSTIEGLAKGGKKILRISCRIRKSFLWTNASWPSIQEHLYFLGAS